jgi:3-phenylpropionate/trans-cinnamate dioxygenase ferredoxin reductase component
MHHELRKRGTSGDPIVIIGCGQAGGWAAKTLRQEGHQQSIVMIGDEPHPPYERPPLSKSVLVGAAPAESTHLFPAAAWQALAIEHLSSMRAVAIEPDNHRIQLSDGRSLPYHRLLLATGGRARELAAPGAALPGIHYLRTIADSLSLAAELRPGGRLLVVGGGWIGLEVAAAARRRGMDVVLVEAANQLCGRALSPDIAGHLERLHRDQGVDIRLNCAVSRFAGAMRVERAQLTDGATIDVSAAVIGIGIAPNSELAAAAGLGVDNGIIVDEYGRTSRPDIFAVGDVANHPNALVGRRIRLESWENAQNQAILAAKAMLGKAVAPYAEVPWFWSDQYDMNVQLIGLPGEWDRIATRGDRAGGSFLVCYFKAGRMQGAVGINSGRDLKLARRLMQANVPVDSDRICDPAIRLQDLVKKISRRGPPED